MPQGAKYSRYCMLCRVIKKDETEKLMNDFDTKFIAPEEIELTDNQGNVSALTLEANVHIVDQGTTHTK